MQIQHAETRNRYDGIFEDRAVSDAQDEVGREARYSTQSGWRIWARHRGNLQAPMTLHFRECQMPRAAVRKPGTLDDRKEDFVRQQLLRAAKLAALRRFRARG